LHDLIISLTMFCPYNYFSHVTFYHSSCTKLVKCVVMYLGVKGFHFTAFYDFSIRY
jgi:hypothetical protein